MVQQIPARHALLLIVTVYDLASFIKVKSLMTWNCQCSLASVVRFEELLHVLSSHHTSTLILKKRCRITFEDANVKVFAKALQCDTGQKAAQRAPYDYNVLGLC
jgi:hypothetical protein